MKVAIITDQHFGARKGSKFLHEYFKKFYDTVFFPYLEENGIDTVVDMGDTFDNRRSIDLWSLEWAKENYYDRLEKLGVTVHTIVGNHTAYYKDTNSINSVDLLLKQYKNVHVYSECTEVMIDRLQVLFIPWINAENTESSIESIKVSTSSCAMGHLELRGFAAYRGHIMEEGLDGKLFASFSHVYSGHYHTRSTDGRISYLGNPYEIYSNDIGDPRGFHILETSTMELEAFDNPYTMYEVINYNDTPHQTFDTRQYEGKIVKLIVQKKSDPKKYEKFVDKLLGSNINEMKIVETFADVETNFDDYDPESEDTISILSKYIDESEMSLNKAEIKHLIHQVYKQACELI